MMFGLSNRNLALLAMLGLGPASVQAQTTCRKGKDKTPHQQALWQEAFPNTTKVQAMCDGTVEIQTNGDICINGRVSYAQLAAAVGTPIRAPAQSTISVTGHLVSGSGNVVLGYEANYLYDFVTSYVVNGVEYTAGTTTADNLLAASNGLITRVCLDKSFTKPEELYDITHQIWFPGDTDIEDLVEANIIYASIYAITAEYHRPSTNGPWFGTITNTLVTFAAGLTPPFVFKWLPLLGAAGIFRFFVVGSVSTSQFPQPLTAPDNTMVENIQIDTEWSTLITAMADGLFTTTKAPAYFGVLIKRIEPLTTKSCWPVTAASIDIQAPKGSGKDLDKWVEETVRPFLEARGNVALHFGKRVASGSNILASALKTYNTQCGVSLNKSPSVCYHPMCTRSTTTSSFVYPESLFQAVKK